MKSEIQNRRGMYVYPMTTRRKKKNPDAMGIGTVGRFEDKTKFTGFKEDEDEEEEDISP